MAKHSSTRSSPPPPRSLQDMHNEHLYLATAYQRQGDRVRSLLASLAGIRSQTSSSDSLTKSQQRKLRKDAGFLQSKIAAAEQQERQILQRLGDVWTEMQSRARMCQLAMLEAEMGRLVQEPLTGPPLEVPSTPLTVPLTVPTVLPTPVLSTTVLPTPSTPSISPLAPPFHPQSKTTTETETTELQYEYDTQTTTTTDTTTTITDGSTDSTLSLSLSPPTFSSSKRHSLPPVRFAWE